MLSEGTWNQLRWAESHNKVIGIRKDYRSSISDNIYPVKLKVTGNEDYWNDLEQVVIVQGEFNSVGLGFMHFMDPELNYKNNPYKVMKIWIDIGGEEKEQCYGIQQVYHDSIRCKIIGTPEQIEGVKAHKKYEEQFDINDELERIRAYSTNEWYISKEQVKRLKNSGEETRVTTVDDYDIEYEVYSNWKTYKKGLIASKRGKYLEDQLVKIEERLIGLEEWEIKLYNILAREYGVNRYDIDERHLLAEDAGKIAKEFETHPAEIWKAFWVYIRPWVEKELNWLENNL